MSESAGVKGKLYTLCIKLPCRFLPIHEESVFARFVTLGTAHSMVSNRLELGTATKH